MTRKDLFVAGDHIINPSTSMKYSSIVSQESVRVVFLLAALNDMGMLTGDIGNFCLNVYIVFYCAGSEWDPVLKGIVCVIIGELYD